jgi:hypothetical protein
MGNKHGPQAKQPAKQADGMSSSAGSRRSMFGQRGLSNGNRSNRSRFSTLGRKSKRREVLPSDEEKFEELKEVVLMDVSRQTDIERELEKHNHFRLSRQVSLQVNPRQRMASSPLQQNSRDVMVKKTISESPISDVKIELRDAQAEAEHLRSLTSEQTAHLTKADEYILEAQKDLEILIKLMHQTTFLKPQPDDVAGEATSQQETFTEFGMRSEDSVMENSKRLMEKLATHRLESECCICISAPRSIASLPCRHVNMCLRCSKDVNTCPVCRADIQFKVRMFL